MKEGNGHRKIGTATVATNEIADKLFLLKLFWGLIAATIFTGTQMALMLLHRFGDPSRQICLEGWQQKAGNLHDLQDLLWPI